MTESRNSLAPPLPMSALGWRDRFVAAAYAFVGFTVLGLFAALVPVFVGQIVDINNQATVGLVVFTVFVASSFGHRLLERALGTRTLVASSIGLGWGSSRSASPGRRSPSLWRKQSSPSSARDRASATCSDQRRLWRATSEAGLHRDRTPVPVVEP